MLKFSIFEDEFIEVKEIFDGGALQGVDEKVGWDVGEDHERHRTNGDIEF